MVNSKLWRAFSVFSPTEIKQFTWFLESPYHNQREDTRALFQAMKQFRSEGIEPKKEEIWKCALPAKSWSGTEFRHLCRYLLALMEEFLAINDWRKTDDIRIRTAGIYADRGLDEMAAAIVRKIKSKLARSSGKGSASLLNAYLLERVAFIAHEREKRSFRPGLQTMSDTLDRWYLVQKLRLAATMGSQQKMFHAEYDIRLLDEVLEMASQSPWREEPLVAVYARTYEMLSDENPEAAYRSQIGLLLQNTSMLNPNERRYLFLMAINFCIRQLNKGLTEYLPEVYQLYKRGLEEQWLFDHGQLSPWTYKNIVSASLKLRDFAWADQFIEQYRNYLPEDLRLTFHQYNLAELQLARSDFRAVLRTLRYLQIKDPLTQLRSRILQICAGFELEEFRLIESQLENLRQLLSRKKELAYHREAYRNFERFLRRLMAMSPDDDRTVYLSELEGTEIVAEKDWLEEKGRGFTK